eukprot:c21524_g1_i1 orf=168-1151(+)
MVSEGVVGSDACREAKPTAVHAPPSNAILSSLGLLLWLGLIHFNVFVAIVSVFFLPTAWTFTLFGFMVVLMVIPLGDNSQFAQGVARIMCKSVASHFPVTLVVDDMEAFDPNQAYLIAVEPHSVLPLGIVALSNYTGYMPFTRTKILATSVIFFIPIVRHLWSWLGLVPASMKVALKQLMAGYTCVVIPGGVREMLFMEHNREIAFLKKRYGFVRTAIQTGSPLVPAFIFGQSYIYNWWKPNGKLYDHFARAIGAAPIVFWGVFGSPVPHRRPMYVAVGKPIHVEKNPDPPFEVVKALHIKFLSSLEDLFENHKVPAGYTDSHLYIL